MCCTSHSLSLFAVCSCMHAPLPFCPLVPYPTVTPPLPPTTTTALAPISCPGLIWQEIPPLRRNTGEALGCLWGRAAAASSQKMIDLCVVAVGTRGPHMERARTRVAALSRLLAHATTTVSVSSIVLMPAPDGPPATIITHPAPRRTLSPCRPAAAANPLHACVRARSSTPAPWRPARP